MPRHTDYYESDRALGVLYRSITFEDPKIEPINQEEQQPPITDPISQRLEGLVKPNLNINLRHEGLTAMFKRYVDELNYICATHVLSSTSDNRLTEAEIVAGAILAKCSQKRWRKDRTYRMRLHASTLVRDIQQQLVEDLHSTNRDQIVDGLSFAWAAWEYSQRQGHAFGAGSFGLIALGVIFDCLDRLGGAEVLSSDAETENLEEKESYF